MLTAATYVVAALGLGIVVPHLRRGLFGWLNPSMQQDQVITFLSSVSAGMMAFTGIVFSLLFVMLQFSSSAYSPHLLPMLSRNRTLIHAGGVFTGTFLYSLMALRGVGIAEGGGTAAILIWVAFAWLLASVFLLLRLVRVFSALAITDVLEMVADTGWQQLDRTYSPYSPELEAARHVQRERATAPAGAARVVQHVGKPRYVVGLDVARLIKVAVAADAFIRVPVSLGDAVTAGLPLAFVHGPGAGRVAEARLRAAIILDRDRTVEAGPKQAIRLLVDIAIRALSPAINDPTTAVRALDQIEGMLLRIGNSDLEADTIYDGQGAPRVSYRPPTWDEYLDLALREIGQYGAGALQVERRLSALLLHVREQLPDDRRAAVDRISAQQRTTLLEAIPDVALRQKAEGIDRQGIGHTVGDAA
jgi:uncharacterized membrane protein